MKSGYSIPLGSSTSAGPIITIPAYTLTKGQKTISLGTSFTNGGRISARQAAKIPRRGEAADDSYGSLINSLNLAYGLTDDLSLMLSYPFTINYGVRELDGGVFEDFGSNAGFGDMSLLAQYHFLDSKKYKFSSALLGGVQMPTGEDNKRGNTGELFEGHLQPSSGSWDPMFGIAISKQLGNFDLDLNFLYQLNIEGSQNTDVGDRTNYNLALSYAINHDHEERFTHSHSHGEHPAHDLHFLERIFPEHSL